ncbi:basement membrane-specific heparan sulfate proteoglycan core protein isoform X3 [Diabrotica virgifera virgifera]|uniref:Papilin-like n=1 Tax=Diabrotica virgifera virgifera TaxID=50390 RepID=A0ABM5L6K8_DIAVI|nr:basement membrane-specific heparan sulfate proteoglycan core protein isoform X3 [Diabrotica virgifera virgifera]
MNKLIVLCIYLILQCSYGDDDTIDAQVGCFLPKDKGQCRNYTTAWFFDVEYGGCSRFWYGGCEGNANRYKSKEECEDTCVDPEGAKKCNLPKVSGPCEGYYVSYYYEKDVKTCFPFTYGGCLGNSNRFNSREECMYFCGEDDIQVPPRISLNSTKLVVYPGEQAYINCSATGDQPIKISWRFFGSDMPTSVTNKDGYISFNDIQLEHAGTYVCVATNPAGNSSAKVDLIVKVPPRISLTSYRLEAHPGEYHFINCNATGDQPIEISWSSLGRDMPNSVFTKDGYVSFNSTQLQDAGRYLCVAKNEAGKAGAVADVIIEPVPPRINLSSTRLELRLGDSGFVDCYANGEQPIDISWSAWEHSMPKSVYIRDRVIGFNNIQMEHAGKYLCVAKNRGGKASAEVDVIVKVPPRITLNSSRLIAHLGQYHLTNSSATGDQPFEIFSPAAVSDMPSSVTAKGGYISFNDIQLEHVGNYLCLASNRTGKADAVTDVIVEPVPPTITLSSKILEAHIGQLRSITCNATGDQPIDVYWLPWKRSLPNNVLIDGRDIIFNTIQWQHHGKYVCVAKNPAGIAEAFADVNVTD